MSLRGLCGGFWVMGIKDTFTVKSIKPKETHDWLLHKHYAKRVPSISYAFGLFNGSVLCGVITFGMPPNYIEMQAWEPYDLLELNRLVTNDNMPKNTTSYFVSKAIKMLPRPKVLISYSDIDNGHYGYIYQATNWIYTGIGGAGCRIYIMKNGKELHQRHENKIQEKNIKEIKKTTGKCRYYYFHANKRDKRKMIDIMRFEELPYPKGENENYDASYRPQTQTTLF